MLATNVPATAYAPTPMVRRRNSRNTQAEQGFNRTEAGLPGVNNWAGTLAEIVALSRIFPFLFQGF